MSEESVKTGAETKPPSYGRQRIGVAVTLVCGLALAIVFSISGEAPPRQQALAPVPQQDRTVEKSTPVQINSNTTERLTEQFDRLGYTLEAVQKGSMDVPRVLPDDVPHNFNDMQDAKERKKLFLRMMLPLVLVINDSILETRDRIQSYQELLEAGKTLAVRDQLWLDERFKEYKVENRDFDALIKRVDIVPASLALAQAAVESGWGTSRFAREGNALFGQWTWSKNAADGIVPEKRAEGKTHMIKSFRAPVDAVASYFRNLNTHRAYRGLRNIRASMRGKDTTITGTALAEGLESYSEKGYEYVELIRQIIRTNQLGPLDEAVLAPTRPDLPRITSSDRISDDVRG